MTSISSFLYSFCIGAYPEVTFRYLISGTDGGGKIEKSGIRWLGLILIMIRFNV